MAYRIEIRKFKYTRDVGIGTFFRYYKKQDKRIKTNISKFYNHEQRTTGTACKWSMGHEKIIHSLACSYMRFQITSATGAKRPRGPSTIFWYGL